MLLYIFTAIVLLLVFLGVTTIVITPQQSLRLIETFGKYSSIRRAGLSFKAPWPIQEASEPFSLQLQEIAVEVGVKSKDNAFVQVPIRVQYLVDDTRAKEAYYLLANPLSQIKSYVVNQVRSTASGMSFDELFTSKDAFERDVQETLTEKMSDFGYIIRNVLVDDPQPSDELKHAFDRVIASQRLMEAATNEGEAERILLVAQASAEKESMVLRGEAISRFRKTITEGNAEAIAAFIKNTDLTPEAALEFITGVNEMEAVTRAAESGGRVVFITASAKRAGADPLTGLLAEEPAKPVVPASRRARSAG